MCAKCFSNPRPRPRSGCGWRVRARAGAPRKPRLVMASRAYDTTRCQRRTLLLSVLADTNPFNPLERCAISRAVMVAIDCGLDLSDAELCYLAYMKCPIVIHFMLEYFKLKSNMHSFSVWKEALAAAVQTYSADSPVASMDTQYYSHWTNTTASRESLVLPYIHRLFTTTLTNDTFKTACSHFKPDWKHDTIETNAALLLHHCHIRSASHYKPYHCVRTVAVAKKLLLPVTKDKETSFVDMSGVVVDMRKWLYPAHVTTVQQARTFIESEVKALCKELGVGGVGGARMGRMFETFSRGDEACLMCEGSHCCNYKATDVEAMERCVKLGLHETWRVMVVFRGGGKQGQPVWSVVEAEEGGCFCGPVRSIKAPVKFMKTCC